jgi:hypothetical protein
LFWVLDFSLFALFCEVSSGCSTIVVIIVCCVTCCCSSSFDSPIISSNTLPRCYCSSLVLLLIGPCLGALHDPSSVLHTNLRKFTPHQCSWCSSVVPLELYYGCWLLFPFFWGFLIGIGAPVPPWCSCSASALVLHTKPYLVLLFCLGALYETFLDAPAHQKR